MEIVETLVIVGKIAGAFVAIWAAIKLLARPYRWLRSWKVIKRDVFNRLKTIESQHQQCRLDKLLTTKVPESRLEERREVEVESEFDPSVPVRNRKY